MSFTRAFEAGFGFTMGAVGAGVLLLAGVCLVAGLSAIVLGITKGMRDRATMAVVRQPEPPPVRSSREPEHEQADSARVH